MRGDQYSLPQTIRIKIKATMRVYHSHPEWSTWHHETTRNSGKNVGKKKPSAPVSGVKAGGATLKIRVEAAKKLKQIFIWFSCPTIPGHMYTQKGLSIYPRDTCTSVSVGSLFTIPRRGDWLSMVAWKRKCGP